MPATYWQLRGWQEPFEQWSCTGPAQKPVACQLGQSASAVQRLVQIERGEGGPAEAGGSTERHSSGAEQTPGSPRQSRPKLLG